MMSSRRLNNTDTAPLSVETVRRNILTVTDQVETDTRQFVERYADPEHIGSPVKWRPYVENACHKSGKPISTLYDYKDLEHVLQKIRSDQFQQQHDESVDEDGEVRIIKKESPVYHHQVAEHIELRKMIERGRMFEYISFSLRNEAVGAYENKLEKYCISFYQESKGQELKAVKEYERIISECRREIKGNITELDRHLDDLDRFKGSLVEYLNNYGAVILRMKAACQSLRNMCPPMKKWVAADAVYHRRIQDEISGYSRRKLDLKEIIKELETERDKYGRKLKKSASRCLVVENKVKEAKDEKRYFRRRELDIQEGYEKSEAELKRKRSDFEDVRGKISRKDNSPAMFNYLSSMAEALRGEMRMLDEKMDTMEGQMASLRKDQAKTQRAIDRLTAEEEELQFKHKSILEKVKAYEDNLKAVNEDIESNEQKIRILKRIREVKLHSDTVKKIHNHGYNPEHIIEIRDDMKEAFRLTSEDVGKDWVTLYQRLPFDPPRDFRERQRDIEVIDLNHRRLEAGYNVLAMKSLEKWHRLSDLSSVDDLIGTLKKMRMDRTAMKIRRYIAMKLKRNSSLDRTSLRRSPSPSERLVSSSPTRRSPSPRFIAN